MKKAIVLSGGGARGAYQMGFWKAIRQLGIKYDIVTGTSIGALNGMLMVQKSYYKAYKLWYFMNYDMVLDDKFDDKYETNSEKRKLMLKYAKGAIKGGFSVSALEKTIKDSFDAKTFFSSNIDYGLITVSFPSLKPIMVTKKKMTPFNAVDYFVASAACFPAFKMKDIDNKKYIDGGFYDNLPINLAIKMGAKEIIAVDLKAVGNVKKVNNKEVSITTISPRNEIGNFLKMEKEQARKSIKYGYNDTMKTFNVLEGDNYTFKRGSLKRNYIKNYESFIKTLNLYTKNAKIKYKKIFGKDNFNEFNKILQQIATAFEIDDTKIYKVTILNALIKKEYKNNNNLSFKEIRKMIKEGKIKKYLVNRELICYIYKELNKRNKTTIVFNNLSMLFPNSYICALYLKTIMDR